MESEQVVDKIANELEKAHGYEVLESLGQGSFGAVFSAYNKITD